MPITLFHPKTGEKVKAHPVAASSTKNEVLDLVDVPADLATAEHYSKQWGAGVGFQSFARQNPEAMKATPGRQLGWDDLFDRIRAEARQREVLVYDAACGFGGIMDLLFRDPVPAHLVYVGADVHGSLADLARPPAASPSQITMVRWDISNPLPVEERFDYVICRASIHHTPKPEVTFASLREVLAPGGTLAISAYALKGRLRETMDDALRAQIAPMPVEDAVGVASELTRLAEAFQKLEGRVTIDDDLTWLGIPKGTYGVHELLYDHVMKFWFNPAFGRQYSDVVNFDWYHPTHAYRYRLEELEGWFARHGIELAKTTSTKAQHYLEGVCRRA